jgi:hypothetical protein
MLSIRYSSEILMKLEVFRQMMLNFMKIRPMGAELFYADGQKVRQTDGQTDRQT